MQLIKDFVCISNDRSYLIKQFYYFEKYRINKFTREVLQNDPNFCLEKRVLPNTRALITVNIKLVSEPD